MLAELGPALVDILHFLTDVAWAAGLAWRGMRRLAGVQLDAIEVPRLTDELAAAQAELEAFDASFEKRMKDFGKNLSGDQLNAVLEREGDRKQAILDRIESLQRDLATALGPGEDVAPPELPARPPLDLGGRGGGALSAEATAERETALQREIRTLAERTNELTRMAEAQASLDPAMEGYTVALRAAEVEAKLLARAEAENVEVTGELAERIREVARAYAEAEAASGALREEQENLDQGARIFEEMARGLEGAIGQARSFEEALKNVALQLANMAVQGLKQPGGGILGSLLSGAGGLAGIFGGGGGGVAASAVAAAVSGGAGLYAKGGVFANGRVTPFASGGIVSSPTIFPMANGMGLMGEAGPEAIMPLKRGPGGRLGVEAAGGGRSAPVTIEQTNVFQGTQNINEVRAALEENNKNLMEALQQQRRLDGSFLGEA